MHFIFETCRVALLVIVGIIFFLHVPAIINFFKGESKIMKKKQIVVKGVKWAGLFLCVLGGAFFFGSYLAYVQGVLSQIKVLAAVGMICVVAGLIALIAGHMKLKKVEV